jgi:hypothetical protein
MAQQKTIRGEIRHLAMTAVVVALIVTFMISAVYKIVAERIEAAAELKVLAEITALNSQTALMFRGNLVCACSQCRYCLRGNYYPSRCGAGKQNVWTRAC